MIVPLAYPLGLTSFTAGYTGTPAAFFTGAPIATQSTLTQPYAAPISLGGSARTLLLTGTGGTGFGTAVGTQTPNLVITARSRQILGCR